MYFVDRQKIEETLKYIESMISMYEGQSSWHSNIELKALERIGHVLIESVLDVGNAIIDGFIMRDPGSYEDIIDILEDEKVLSNQHAQSIKTFIALRKVIVQNYINIDHAQLHMQLEDSLPSLKSFPLSVRTYLENELGSVTTFIN